MSMVIMNAWKTPFKTLDEVVAWGIGFRPKMRELADEKFNNLVTNLTLNTIDYIFKNKSLPEKTIDIISKRYNSFSLKPDYDLSWQIEMEASIAIKYEAISMEKNSSMDFRSEMVFIPYNGNIYAQWFGDDREWEKIFDSIGWEEYWYDGRSDGDGDIPYEEYEARGKIWSKIYDKVDTSSEAGVVIDLLANKYYRYKKQVITEERRNKIIGLYIDDHLLYEFWLNLNDNKIWAEEKIKTNGSFSVYDKYRGWTKTEEGKSKKNFLIDEYSKKYPSTEKINKYFSMNPAEILKDLGE